MRDICNIIICVVILPGVLISGQLTIEKSQLIQSLDNILSYLNVSQELPQSNLLIKQKPEAVITFSTAAGLNKKDWYGNPSLWSGTNITKNMMISAGINRYSTKKQSVRSFGSTLTYIAGQDSIRQTGTYFITAGLNFLEGTSDFDYKDYHISVYRKIFIKDYRILLGFSKHYNQVDLKNITKNRHRTLSTNYLKTGIFKQYRNLIYGIEVNIWSNYLGVKMNVSGLMP